MTVQSSQGVKRMAVDRAGLLQQDAPAGQRWPQAQAQPAQGSFCQDHARDGQGGDHDDVAHRAREQVAEHHARIDAADALGRQHVFTFAQGEDQPAHLASQAAPAHEGQDDGQHEIHRRWATRSWEWQPPGP